MSNTFLHSTVKMGNRFLTVFGVILLLLFKPTSPELCPLMSQKTIYTRIKDIC